MATITLTLDLPYQDADWLRKLEPMTEIVIVKERGDNSGLIPQAVLLKVEDTNV